MLREEPFCRIRKHCSGAPTTDVDHILPKGRGGTDKRTNLQGACHECHSWKTVTQDGGFGRFNTRGGAR